MTTPIISVVATLYKSQDYIVQFCERIRTSAAALEKSFEIVLVNDGSPDRSAEIARDYADRFGNIVLVDLSRNFGHHQAMMAGLRCAKGDFIFLIDSDLEEEPEWLEQFWPKLFEHGCDVVYGVQASRRGSFTSRVCGHLYYHISQLLTGLSMPLDLVTARLMTRRYVDALLQFHEREIDIAALWVLTGFEQKPIQVIKHDSSPTTYTLAKKVALLVNSITSYSNRPLLGIFYFGAMISAISGAYVFYLVVNRIFFDATLEGWTSLMASIWLLGGLIISFVGIIGIYLAKVFAETKQRPLAIVKEIYPKGYTAIKREFL
ncbi:MAG: glycosyltransferase family 2 protein [Hydrogenophaga sp.]|nr:glycosyltransferase family 2 protein [Hydrogenophaga sp.]